MPYRHQQFVNNEISHIVLKAIDNNLFFKDINDYYRGIFSIYEFNDLNSVIIRERRRIRAQIKRTYRGPSSVNSVNNIIDERDKLVEILAFCFMPNHIHLLLRQLKDDGITKFMSKIGTGLGGYFNRKYERKGYVFQNRFHAVHIENDEQLITVFIYIHANPISLIELKWKEIGIKYPEKVIEFLENYKWSSYLDYIGKKNFPSITEREFIRNLIGNKERCKEVIDNWVKYKGKIKEFANLALE